MKSRHIIGFLILLALGALALPPAAPKAPYNPLLPPPTNVVILTNITQVYTNVAVRTPTHDFPDVTIYGGEAALKGSFILSWNFNPEPDVAGYNVVYGTILGTDTNVFTTLPTVNALILYSTLKAGSNYWFYAQAFSTSGLTSGPSQMLISSPKP